MSLYTGKEKPVIGKLIWVSEGRYIHIDEVVKLDRCGNYTDIVTKDGSIHQIWDQGETVWSAIMEIK